MKKKEFQNLPSTETPINAENLNEMQDNIEESCVVVSPTEPTTNEKVWIQKRKNLLDYNNLSKNAMNFGIRVDDNDNIFSINPSGDGRAWDRDNCNWLMTLPVGTYTLSLAFSNKTTVNTSGLYICKNGVKILNTSDVINADSYSYTFTLEEEAEIGIELKVYDGVCTIQLEEGSIATEYQAYIDEKVWVRNSNGVFIPFVPENKPINITTGVEFETGRIIDGKREYGKKINCGNLPAAKTPTYTPHGLTNFTLTRPPEGYAFSSTYNAYIPLPFVERDENAGYNVTITINKEKIVMDSDLGQSHYYGYVTLYYTKN